MQPDVPPKHMIAIAIALCCCAALVTPVVRALESWQEGLGLFFLFAFPFLGLAAVVIACWVTVIRSLRR